MAAIGNIFSEHRIRTLPQTRARVVVSRPVIVEPRLRIVLLGREEIRGSARLRTRVVVAAGGSPGLAAGGGLDALVDAAFVVGHPARRAEVVGVVVVGL